MRQGTLLLASVVAALFVAGCLGGAAPSKATAMDPESMPHSHDQDMMGMEDHEHHGMNIALLKDFKVEFKDCKEAGGVSLYDMPPEGQTGPVKGGPFRLYSISDDTGNPKIGTYGQPLTKGGSNGIWHIALACTQHSLDGKDLGPYEGGWVAQRIYAPPWDNSGIVRQYFVADLSFNAGPLVNLIKESTGLHASRNLDAKIDFVAPTTLHTILDDEDHGVFETHGKTKMWEPKDSLNKIRFWMLINPAGHGHGTEGSEACECIPISFDLENTAGSYQVFDGTGWLSHSRTDAHSAPGPVPVQEPAATGNVGGMAYTGFDRVMTLGPMPGIIVDKTWLH
jgi:hypothetical protein